MLEEEIKAELERFNVPGASWVVIEDGAVHETGTAGLVAADGSQAVAPDTLFQAASISKPIAVLAMLRLVDRGLLDLDEDVNHKLTSWQVPPTGAWQPVVTLRQLASHSGGLTVHGFPGYAAGAPLPTTLQILEGVRPTNTFGVRVDLVPGTQFRYAGGGTIVMQQLLEDVTGTPFRQLARELVLEPLGMSDSDYAHPLPPELHNRAAVAHDERGRSLEGRWHAYPELAAAGLWTTPTDLAKAAIGVQKMYAGVDGALLPLELAREMLTHQIAAGQRIGGLGHLGLGFFLNDSGQRFGHSGGNAGFRCHLLADRDTGQGAVVMTNGDNGGWVVQRAFAAVASAYGWEEYPAEVEAPDLPSDELLTELVGTYRLDGRMRFTVERWGSGLEVTFDRQPPQLFMARSATTFSAMETESGFEVRDGGLAFEQEGVVLDCVRE
ncbi:serine hydrolase domain-containing protein [Kribbella jiaozuonensis]|uniref:Serine hydrolase n=1 Tax=Kribbella jiaozuonensis TaxID=2575441 RepID=A0A4U3LBF6_9ACTN|nr:serine hydrolase domain-containing protein [Kribbella jiaozuonensis]TKK72550.1 serine hydrolase [Kribbella jiaozuonensis]